MRNFWLTADIDGRETLLEGGPRSKTGGMVSTFYMRDDGCSVVACKVDCLEVAGELHVRIYDADGNEVFEVSHKR